MKKFLIQWKKFELKRSYIKEDMNFLILVNFYGFYFNFAGIFQIYFFIKKMQKWFILSRGTRRADVVRRAHVAELREATWTHVDAYVVRVVFGLADDGPMG